MNNLIPPEWVSTELGVNKSLSYSPAAGQPNYQFTPALFPVAEPVRSLAILWPKRPWLPF